MLVTSCREISESYFNTLRKIRNEKSLSEKSTGNRVSDVTRINNDNKFSQTFIKYSLSVSKSLQPTPCHGEEDYEVIHYKSPPTPTSST